MNGTKTGSDVAYGFVFSQEFINKNTTNEEYLQILHEAFFNRQPDPAGLQGWFDALAGGSSREDILNGFIYATEFAELCEEYAIKAFKGHTTKAQREAVKAFVTRFYQLCLDRYPDTAGLEGWANNLINQIQTGADVANGFIFSPEFVNKNTTNDEYLTILYKAFFNRDPDQAGWDGWLSELNAGKNRGEILDGFIYSAEFSNLCCEYGINAFAGSATCGGGGSGGGDSDNKEKTPSLALMVAQDTDKVVMAWIPGSDGITPVDQIKYDIHLSTSEDFTPGPTSLRKTVTGASQTEITGLAADTLYFGKVVAEYSTFTSNPSNGLQTKTYKYKVQQNKSTIVEKATDLGLSKHTTSDGTTYTYTGITKPTPGSVLFSEDIEGGMTLRKVDTATYSHGKVTVHTSDASLTDVLDRASIYSSIKLFDVASQDTMLPAKGKQSATANSLQRTDGIKYTHIEWKNRLLSAEQISNTYNEEPFSLQPRGKSSILTLKDSDSSVSSEFKAEVTAEFEPECITKADWGGIIEGKLDSAHVAAKGTLSLTALAQYDFSAQSSFKKGYQLWSRTWRAIYSVGPAPVYQEITLSMDVHVFAHASAEIHAQAKANLSETVEVGAKYDGTTWTPYIDHEESGSISASLDIAGKADGTIILVPKIEVAFYKTSSASFELNSHAMSILEVKNTTDQDFLWAHPERLILLDVFGVFLTLEAYVEANLYIIGINWEIFPPYCVLGLESCLYEFDSIELFSIPQLKGFYSYSNDGTQIDVELQAIDGVFNRFSRDSVKWEVFPADAATITQGSCSKTDQTTTCLATLTQDATQSLQVDGFKVFVSGHGILGEVARRFVTFEFSSLDTDRDDDGYDGEEFGGDDCDDDNYYINPAATDIPNDGIDQDCDGKDATTSETDWDDDGYNGEIYGGDDCDDDNYYINPGATDIPNDGIDQDCDGKDAEEEYVIYTVDGWTCFEARIVIVGTRSRYDEKEFFCDYFYPVDKQCTIEAKKDEIKGGFTTRAAGYEHLERIKGEFMINRWCPGNGYHKLEGESGWYMIF